jgi:hypothetical protein
MLYRNDLTRKTFTKHKIKKFTAILFFYQILFLLSSCTTKELFIMENIDDLLKATLTSKGKREVAYEKWKGVGIEFTIKNISNFDISIPLERIEQSGLGTTVKNRKTGQRMDSSAGLPWAEIINPFFVLHPGEQVTIKDSVFASDIEYFKQNYVDLDLEVLIGFVIQINDQSSYILLQDTIPILDIEKPPTKN